MSIRMPAPRLLAWTALALVVAIAGCRSGQTTAVGTLGVDRSASMSAPVSEADLRRGAEQAYAALTRQAREAGELNADPELTRRVRAIAQRMIPATAAFRPDAPGWNWEVNVLRSDRLDAWCMPGGKIALHSGIVTRLALTDDEIAAVIAHEIAHALREHARERASELRAAGPPTGAGASPPGSGPAGADLGEIAYRVAVGMPNSPAHEAEADRIGVELAARAGYDPRAAIALWQKMAKAGGAGASRWPGTHPSAATRQRELAAYAERAMPFYLQARP